jgi:hypothetical protein
MISGAHVVVYSKNAEADRTFFRDILGFKSVDAGHGWLIFALPPTVAKVEGQRIGDPVRLTLDDRQDIPFDWTPDGKSVLFISDRTGTFNVYRQAIDQIWQPKKMGVYWAIPSRDGKYLALHVGSTSANAWMLEHP